MLQDILIALSITKLPPQVNIKTYYQENGHNVVLSRGESQQYPGFNVALEVRLESDPVDISNKLDELLKEWVND